MANKIEAIFTSGGTFKGWSENTMIAKFYPIADKDGKYKEYFEATPSGSLELSLSAKAEGVQKMLEGVSYGQKLYRVTIEEITE
jgi:hypothetical protein